LTQQTGMTRSEWTGAAKPDAWGATDAAAADQDNFRSNSGGLLEPVSSPQSSGASPVYLLLVLVLTAERGLFHYLVPIV